MLKYMLMMIFILFGQIQLMHATQFQSDQILSVYQNPVLCVEIGGKKTIAALIPSKPNLEDLRSIKILNFSSKPWFLQLPFLFTKSTDNPLLSLLQQPYSHISVSIFGPLFKQEGFIDVAKRNIPANLEILCKEQSERPLDMFVDSVCWAVGCLEYHKMKEQTLITTSHTSQMDLYFTVNSTLNLIDKEKDQNNSSFPFLAIILKTGIGVTLVEENKVSAVEIPYIGCSFPQLEMLCIKQGQQFNKFDVHQALGNRFFDWALKKREFEDAEMIPYLHLYQERFKVFIEEILNFFKISLGIEAKSIFVGGENSRFIHPLPFTTILNMEYLAKDGIHPEIIQLLGCLKISQKKDWIIETYPSYDKIMNNLQ